MTTSFNNAIKSNYRLTIERLPKVSFFTRKYQHPGLALTPISIPHMGPTLKLPGGPLQFSESLSLRFLVDENYENYLEIYNWMRDIGLMQHTSTAVQTLGGKPSNLYFSTGIVDILSNKQNPILSFVYNQLTPMSLDAIDFDNDNPQASPIEVGITFAYTTWFPRLLN